MKKILLAFALFLGLMSCEERPTDELVKISTEFGDIYMLLYDETPLHKENFLKLANEKFYDSTTFHRIISGFMIQGGDPNSKDDNPNNNGQGGPGYTVAAEFNTKFFHKKGALCAARMGDQQNPEKRSSGSQFYIAQGKKSKKEELSQMELRTNQQNKNNLLRDFIKDAPNFKLLEELQGYQERRNQDSINLLLERARPMAEKYFVPFKYTPEQIEAYSTIGGTPHLDGEYTVFGEVIKGLDVVDAIATQKGNPKMVITIEVKKREDIEKEFGYKYPEIKVSVKK